MMRGTAVNLVVLSEKREFREDVETEFGRRGRISKIRQAHTVREAISLLRQKEDGSDLDILVTDRESLRFLDTYLTAEEFPAEVLTEDQVQENIDHIRGYVRGHLADALTLDLLAGEINVSSNYLSTMFRKATGLTLRDFIANSRMEHAAYLLENDNAYMKEIASAVGIPNVSYFSRAFKRWSGDSPKVYRRKHGQKY